MTPAAIWTIQARQAGSSRRAALTVTTTNLSTYAMAAFTVTSSADAIHNPPLPKIKLDCARHRPQRSARVLPLLSGWDLSTFGTPAGRQIAFGPQPPQNPHICADEHSPTPPRSTDVFQSVEASPRKSPRNLASAESRSDSFKATSNGLGKHARRVHQGSRGLYAKEVGQSYSWRATPPASAASFGCSLGSLGSPSSKGFKRPACRVELQSPEIPYANLPRGPPTPPPSPPSESKSGPGSLDPAFNSCDEPGSAILLAMATCAPRSDSFKSAAGGLINGTNSDEPQRPDFCHAKDAEQKSVRESLAPFSSPTSSESSSGPCRSATDNLTRRTNLFLNNKYSLESHSNIFNFATGQSLLEPQDPLPFKSHTYMHLPAPPFPTDGHETLSGLTTSEANQPSNRSSVSGSEPPSSFRSCMSSSSSYDGAPTSNKLTQAQRLSTPYRNVGAHPPAVRKFPSRSRTSNVPVAFCKTPQSQTSELTWPHRSGSVFSSSCGADEIPPPENPVHVSSFLTTAIHTAVNDAAVLYESTRWDDGSTPREVSRLSDQSLLTF